jgi:Tol biopolymer transport system component
MVSVRRTSLGALVAGAVACFWLAFTMSTASALGAESEPEAACANVANEHVRKEAEQRRQESNINLTTGKPYSVGLPDCRAYEMVSPLYKQGHDATLLTEGGYPAAPNGDTVGFGSEGDFAEPENYRVNEHPNNPYLSQRCPPDCSSPTEGWNTSSVFAPRSLIDVPSLGGLESDTSPDLRSVRVSCGLSAAGKSQPASEAQSIVCALRQPDGSWLPTPTYTNLSDEPFHLGALFYKGGSSDLSRVIIQPSAPLLPSDSLGFDAGIYEIAGVGTTSPELRLVNFDNKHRELVLRVREEGGREKEEAPLLGGFRHNPLVTGTQYHAISKSGGTVFFTATPAKSEELEGEVTEKSKTVKRLTSTNGLTNLSVSGTMIKAGTTVAKVINATELELSSEVEGSGTATVKETLTFTRGQGLIVQTIYARIGAEKTVDVSNPSEGECGCAPSTPKPATFEGASADGSKVFFTTQQQLLDKDTTTNLYEYDFSKPEGEKLALLSRDLESEGAKAEVLRTSADGSHVYFVAHGVLENKNCENCNAATAKQSNLYGYDTETGETKYVAPGGGLEGIGSKETEGILESEDAGRKAQTTPDGRYLVFSSPEQLAGDTNTTGCPSKCPRAVYRYDFETGELTWVSHRAPGFKHKGEGKNASIARLPNTEIGAEANIDDWNRAISENGEYIIFTTAEQLQASDANQATDVYEWHGGNVRMISDGHDGQGVQLGIEPAAVISASGSDIFFSTGTALVGQDTDVLRDVYDARVGGGFRRPAVPPVCTPESEGGCQGKESTLPLFGPAPSSVFTGGQSLPPTTPSVAPLGARVEAAPKKLTRAQLRARALKACRGKPRKKRKLCESQARRKYASKAKAKTKSAHRRGR